MNQNSKTLSFILALVLTGGVAGAQDPPTLNPKDKMIVETVLRLKDFNIESSAPAKAAILRYLRSQPGTDQYFQLIERFQPVGIAQELTEFCLGHSDQTSGVRGAKLLFEMKQEQSLQEFLKGNDQEQAISAVKLIGQAGGKKTVPILLPLLKDSKAPIGVRTVAVSALGRRMDGQQELLDVVTQGKLPDELKFAVANVLLSSDDNSIASEAAKYLSLPATADSQPLPTVAELVKRTGDATAGFGVFREIGTCSKCHKVRGEGKEVGPDLSEIGSKLSREAMYVSILDPSAAISHNFEAYSVVTAEGEMITGVLINQTDKSVTLRTSEGIDRTINQAAIDNFKKQTKSAMPQDLQRLMTVGQLVDLVEYLMTLQKEGGPPAQTTGR